MDLKWTDLFVIAHILVDVIMFFYFFNFFFQSLLFISTINEVKVGRNRRTELTCVCLCVCVGGGGEEG